MPDPIDLILSQASHLPEPSSIVGDGAAEGAIAGVPPERPPAPEPGMQPLDIIGPDTRKPVPDARQVPWRMICHLIMEDANGSLSVGTGWLAGPSTVFTAGHNLFNPATGQAMRRVWVIPGRDREQSAMGYVMSQAMEVHPQWRQLGRKDADIGVVWLPSPMGRQLGWFGYTMVNDAALASPVIVSGYPQEQPRKPFGTQWFDQGFATPKDAQMLRYLIDTMQGQSGSPVFQRNAQGQPVAIGVHVYGNGNENLAVRITQAMFQQLTDWWR